MSQEILIMVATARDAASPALRQVERAMRNLANAGQDLAKQEKYAAQFSKAWDDLNAKVSKGSREHGKHVQELNERYKEFGERGKKVADFVLKDLTPAFSTFGITALSVSGAITGMAEAAKAFGEQSSKIHNFAQQFGFRDKDVQGLQAVATQYDVSADTIGNALSRISRMHDEFRGKPGHGQMFNDIMIAPGSQDLGKQLENIFNNRSLTTAQQNMSAFEAIIEKGRKIAEQKGPHGGKEFAGSWIEQFGIDRSVLNLTTEGLGELHEAMERHLRLQGELDPEKADRYRKSLNEMSSAFIGLRNAVGSETINLMSGLNDQITKFVEENKEQVGDGIATAFKVLREEADKTLGPLKEVVKLANDFATVLNAVNNFHPGQKVHDALGLPDLTGRTTHLTTEDVQRSLQSVNPMGGGLQGAPIATPDNEKTFGPWERFKKILPFATGADMITHDGLAIVHSGEKIVPAEANGPYKGTNPITGFTPADPEARRTVEQNTEELHQLNQRLDKMLDDAELSGAPLGGGWGPGSGHGGAGSGAAGGGGGGSGAGSGYGPGGSGRGPGGYSGPGAGPDSAGPSGSAGTIGRPGGASLEDSLSANKMGQALGLDKFVKSGGGLTKQQQNLARQMSVGGALGGGAKAAGITGSGRGFDPANPENGIVADNGKPVDPDTLNAAMQIAKTGNAGAMKQFLASRGYPLDATACGAIATKMAQKAGVKPPSSPAMGSSWLNFGQHEDPSEINNPSHGGLGRTFASSKTMTYGPHVGAPIAPGQKYGHVKTVVPGSYDPKTNTAQFIDQYGVHRDKIGNYDIRYAGDIPKQPAYPDAAKQADALPDAIRNQSAGIGGESEYPGVPKALSQFVALKENFTPHAFNDYGQKNIGYGTAANGRTTIDEATARKEMNQHLAGNLQRIDALNPNTPPGIRMALASMDYNTGFTQKDNEKNRAMQEAIRRGDWDTARKMFSTYNHTGGPNGPELRGLTNRRNQELAALWDRPDYNFDRSKVTSAAQDFGGKQDPRADASVGAPQQSPGSNGLLPWPNAPSGVPDVMKTAQPSGDAVKRAQQSSINIPEFARNPNAARSASADDEAHRSLASAESSVRALGADRDVGSLASKPIGSLGAASKMEHSVKLDGGANLHVKVDAPKGTSVKAGTEGKMFSQVKVNRQHSMPHADETGAGH